MMRPFDLQVNGYGGVDFNGDSLTAEALHRACRELVKAGATQILATVITDTLPAMCGRLERLVALREHDPFAAEVIAGLHIEGPFINESPGYVGAHPAEAVVPAAVDSAKRLLEAAAGFARIVTLAPERDTGMAVTRFLAEEGVVVSAGHCNPTLDELDAALDAGLSMFTHVGNGCPMELQRHDNIIQRVLSRSDRLWCCFIADGVHVPFPALGNYLRCVGPERAIIVTDCTAAGGMPPGRYRLGGREIEIGEDLVAWGPGRAHLVGSTVSVAQTVERLSGNLGFDEARITRLIDANPRAALGWA
jgi:N-acetylglucosamine-6-phosphate deacetylase